MDPIPSDHRSYPASRSASAVAFSLAALVFGFGLAAWATTLLLGTTLSAMAETVDADWTVAGTRQAMAVLAALGGGAMVGTALATAVLDAAAALT